MKINLLGVWTPGYLAQPDTTRVVVLARDGRGGSIRTSSAALDGIF